MHIIVSDPNSNRIESPNSHRPKSRRQERPHRRPSHPARQSARIRTDDLAHADTEAQYRADVASKALLTAEQEQALAWKLISAEREVLEALVRIPGGAAALASLGRDLEEGRVDIRTVLLNPDEAGLDRTLVTKRLCSALLGAETRDERERDCIVDALTDIRLDGSVIDRIASGLSTADAATLEEIEGARRRLRDAKQRLVVANLRLVLLFAHRYKNRGLQFLDLVQEGNIGLMRAAAKFDVRRGFRFNTYASFWIKQALQRAFIQRTIRLPVHLAADRQRIARMRAKFMAQHEREPTPEETATFTGLSLRRVESVLALPPQPASLDAPVGDDGDAHLVDFVAGDRTPVDQAVAMSTLGQHLDELLFGLSERELRVLRMRFGIGPNNREHTLEEIGRDLSLTRERIRQIERDALKKLRARSKGRELESFLQA